MSDSKVYSVYRFDPRSRELIGSKPGDVDIPSSAFDLNAEILPPKPRSPTSPLLIAIMITMIILLLLFIFYLLWLWFVKTPDQGPTAIFSSFTG